MKKLCLLKISVLMLSIGFRAADQLVGESQDQIVAESDSSQSPKSDEAIVIQDSAPEKPVAKNGKLKKLNKKSPGGAWGAFWKSKRVVDFRAWLGKPVCVLKGGQVLCRTIVATALVALGVFYCCKLNRAKVAAQSAEALAKADAKKLIDASSQYLRKAFAHTFAGMVAVNADKSARDAGCVLRRTNSLIDMRVKADPSVRKLDEYKDAVREARKLAIAATTAAKESHEALIVFKRIVAETPAAAGA